MKNRLLWVDNLKTIGILAVILGHISSPFSGFIFSWHMPLFFIISGFYIKSDLAPKYFIVKNFQRLLAPYFIFALIGVIVETLKRLVLHRDKLNYFFELKGIFTWMDMTSLSNTYAFVLWFLPTLFFAKLLFFLGNKYIRNIYVEGIFIGGLFMLSFLVDLPFAIDNAMNALLFIFVGTLLFKLNHKSKLLTVLALAILLLIYYAAGIPNLDMATKNYGNIFINLMWAISIIYILIFLLQKLNYEIKYFSILGGNTLLLFAIHPYTNNVAFIVVKNLQYGSWYLTFFISLMMLYPILFIQHYFKNKKFI